MKFVLIDETIVRGGWWAIVSGIDLSQFKKNPIMYWMHQRALRWDGEKQILPIGRWEDIKVETLNGIKSITATPVFDEKDEFALKIKSKVEGNFIRMASAGLRPTIWSDDKKHIKQGQTNSTLVKSEMIESSIVDIGANNNAIRLYDDDGLVNLSDDNSDFIPKLKLETKKTDMKLIALALGLKEDATEAEILSAVNLMKESEKTANETAENLQSERVAELLKSDAITDDLKESIEKLAKSDFELAQKMVATIEAKTEKSKDEIRLSDVIQKKEISIKGDKDKKWDDYSDEERIELREKNTPDYVKLYAEYYGEEPKLD